MGIQVGLFGVVFAIVLSRLPGRLVSNGRFGYFCGAVAAAARPEQNYGIALRSAMYLQTLSEGSVAYACSGN